LEITIRPSMPADADGAVPHVYSSGPYSFDYVFGTQRTTALEFLKFAFTKQNGEFSYCQHVSVIAGDSIIGSGAVLSPQQGWTHSLHAVGQILAHYGPIAGAQIIARGLAIERVIRPAAGDLWIIAHLGIDPRFQGAGVGGRLITHLIDSIRQRGGRRVGLDVAVINPRAEALYKRLGFTVTGTPKSTLSNQFGSVPNFHRMELEL
jgi:ribosomal protein S18 acetylase RimI-like enzyme